MSCLISGHVENVLATNRERGGEVGVKRGDSNNELYGITTCSVRRNE